MQSVKILIVYILLCVSTMVQARELTPTRDGLLYYKIGGGRSYAYAPVDNTTRVPLDVTGNLGLGYSCGTFNPIISITEQFNSIKDSFKHIDDAIVSHVTGAVTAIPLYLVSRADSRLAQFINNTLIIARDDFSLSLKSCEQMESDALAGNPIYDDMVKVSLGSGWKQHMGVARDPHKRVNIHTVKEKVTQDAGKQGIPWLGGKQQGGSPTVGQKPIMVIADTTQAGYNILLDREVLDDSAPTGHQAQQYIAQTWKSPKAAADWIVSVVGDIKLTSCSDNDCEKGIEPGKGLLTMAEQRNVDNHTLLHELVTHQKPMTAQYVTLLSSSGYAVNTNVITTIQRQSPVDQAVLVERISTELTTRQLLDEAMLAQRLMRIGRQIPEIMNNTAVDEFVGRAIVRLDDEIDLIISDYERRKHVSVNTIATLLEFDHRQRLDALSKATQDDDQQPSLRDGAIPKSELTGY